MTTPGEDLPGEAAPEDAPASEDLGDWPSDLAQNGVFDAPKGVEAEAASDPGDALAENSSPFATEPADSRAIDATMPSALSAAGSARAAGRNGLGGADPSRDGRSDGLRPAASAAVPNAFPDVDGRPGDSSFPSWTAAAGEAASADETLAMGSTASGRGTRLPGSGANPGSSLGGGPGPVDRRPGAAGAGARPGSRSTGAQRLQDTEIKLAGRQSAPPKPREPNRLLLGLALALVVLAGAAVAWWLTREDDPNDQVAQADQEQSDTDTTLAGDAAAPEPEAPASDDPILDVPTLSLIDTPPGPLDSTATYSLDLFGEPPGSLLQVVVDDVPQGQPDALLPDLILPAGRHTLVVNATDAAGARTSSPVEVYVLDAPPAEGHIANLASIDIVNEGWDEAIRRYDGYRDAGHQNLRLLPITPGFWNIFVPDLGDDAAVTTYCESFGLAMPDDCFPKAFDPATYQGPVAAPADVGTDTSATDDDGSMTDEGEADPSTSTTTGG